MMIISVYGAGYVGLVSATCLAKLGHQVICADINTQKITQLSAGECPIYEDQLPELLEEQLRAGRLKFTHLLSEAIQAADVHIIATGTPSLADGGADLSQVFAVATRVAQEANKDCILITKSTVPVGTGDAIQTQVNKELAQSGKKIRINVASNPEFLREGTAVYDFLNADRIIVGGEENILPILKNIYEPLVEKGIPLLGMSRRSAELTKYSANAMLACRISFINQISQIAEEMDANIDDIRQGIGLDQRIGPHFLQAGIGYGGSCFPKDVRALVQTAKSIGVDTHLLQSIDDINEVQKSWVFRKLSKHFNHKLGGLTIGIWGLSFKPGTDDLREASSLVAIKALLKADAKLRVFDPVAIAATQELLGNNSAINWCSSMEAVFGDGLDALVIVTEWPEFKNFSLQILKNKLGDAPLFDGRNCFALSKVTAAGLTYYSVGRPLIHGCVGVNNGCK
ncbi:UDP-glucose dehydrogenase family protein [Legionella cardiaca]|uniref:UDP-glucose 6-dehydrogenase n=1 Tax=Legionella cardiaca TaxID=1071983 RepID=A0ABY8AUJ1_9GAMM|nr:UDP-glucose/GDP-mannose dehydrogenase family protein [Legionella cardiaca]WED43826.1 UDP-glucose/GDP-mannose dehydrogenase family protein [Legionella cardiaca]